MRLLLLLAMLAFPAAFPAALAAQGAARPPVTVYKNPWCGCCGGWVEHMRANGFEVEAIDVEDLTPVKTAMSVPESLQSCHTAKIGSYTIEGHVPAADVLRLLQEAPEGVIGLSVPGMVAGSPGMGEGDTPYQVISFTADGSMRVYARY